MRFKLLAVGVTSVLTLAMTTACNNSSDSSDTAGGGGSGGPARIGVILPDTESSARWTKDDPVYLAAAFKAQGVQAEIKNANGDPAQFQKIADDMINGGVTVLMVTNLDSDSARVVLQKARAKGIKTIDYDRLTLGGGADYYVSFNNETVGNLQAKGLKSCMDKRASTAGKPLIAEVNGSPSDNNATMFKAGYDEVLQPLYDDGTYIKGPDQSVPDWNPEKGTKLFTQMLQQQPKINGVLAANDGLADAVIKVLKQHNLAGQVPVTGQDATVVGLQHILAGDQCMTVYKSIKPEAETAAGLAITLFKKGTPKDTGQQTKDPTTGAYIKSVLRDPQAISSAADIKKYVLGEGFVDRKDLCTGVYAGICANQGI